MLYSNFLIEKPVNKIEKRKKSFKKWWVSPIETINGHRINNKNHNKKNLFMNFSLILGTSSENPNHATSSIM